MSSKTTLNFIKNFVPRLRSTNQGIVGINVSKGVFNGNNTIKTGDFVRQASVAILLRLRERSSNTPCIFKCTCNTRDNMHSVQCLEHYVAKSTDNGTSENVTADILYGKKSERIRRRGEVCFPGGHIEKGETPKDAAERETLEEMGIDLKGEEYSYIGRLDDRVTFDKIGLYTFGMLPFHSFIQTSSD
ncbi:hypothetical protein SAMD00019534_057630 [Acytostelium subglobosum LB1]|uniref:hypothetical protein n=1 Tax=Acytostelium subglobosum LB1 TaxID=1410327 RepID=UPI00064523C0|nr:hypothetical protein SAMD00019534_057630 [Acytostelium subglobosum LB1]GAM22588.1 hypothetical protein SAMD00019534_057630 [Acytostelium subglobosum LB1]|eukprot:XP_012754708.1 hypothetical protein SAMD00019534_057630 [Acytostelium subglobosum LB1]